ncbi:MAG: hypothetical protein RIS22_788 [Actinomycetota bacterium]
MVLIRKGSKFRIWDTFTAPSARAGAQLFCCTPINIDIYPFIVFEVVKTFGGSQTYMNRIFLYSEEVVPPTDTDSVTTRNANGLDSDNWSSRNSSKKRIDDNAFFSPPRTPPHPARTQLDPWSPDMTAPSIVAAPAATNSAKSSPSALSSLSISRTQSTQTHHLEQVVPTETRLQEPIPSVEAAVDMEGPKVDNQHLLHSSEYEGLQQLTLAKRRMARINPHPRSRSHSPIYLQRRLRRLEHSVNSLSKRLDGDASDAPLHSSPSPSPSSALPLHPQAYPTESSTVASLAEITLKEVASIKLSGEKAGSAHPLPVDPPPPSPSPPPPPGAHQPPFSSARNRLHEMGLRTALQTEKLLDVISPAPSQSPVASTSSLPRSRSNHLAMRQNQHKTGISTSRTTISRTTISPQVFSLDGGDLPRHSDLADAEYEYRDGEDLEQSLFRLLRLKYHNEYDRIRSDELHVKLGRVKPHFDLSNENMRSDSRVEALLGELHEKLMKRLLKEAQLDILRRKM